MVVLYPKDPRVVILQTTDRMEIRWKTNQLSDTIAMALMTVIFGASSFAVVLAPSTNTYPPKSLFEQANWAILFPILVLVGLLYLTAAAVVTSKVILTTKDDCRFTSVPLPLALPKHFPTQDVVQWFATRQVNSLNQGKSLFLLGSDQIAHRVCNLPLNEIASHQIVHALQDFFGLEDVPIYGVTTHPDHPGTRKT